MAINKNHEFEELEGIKCSIVERNVPGERAQFLKDLLEFNGYTVILTLPAAKPVVPVATAPAPEGVPATEPAAPAPIVETPQVFTVGVTNVMFNPTNAIFGRSLKTRSGRVVTLAYWEQNEEEPQDEIPYFQNPNSFEKEISGSPL